MGYATRFTAKVLAVTPESFCGLFYLKKMNKIKIVWLTPYPVHALQNELVWACRRTYGHPCSWIVNLAKALGRREDIDLYLITLCPWVSFDQAIAHPDGYSLHVLKSGIPFIHKGFPGYIPLDTLSGYRIERRKLVKMIRQLQPDLVHAQGTEYAYGLAAMDAGYPWLVSIQGIIADYLRINPCFRYKLVASLETLVLSHAKFIGGRTHFDKGYVEKLNPAATVFDLPEAMNECFFTAPWKDPGNQRILFVGSYERPKGLRRLIDALGLIAGQFPDLILDAVGGGSREQQSLINDQAADLCVKLNFHGFKNAQEIAELQRNTCLFVLPSEKENSSNALAEAMVSGMPVVAFDTGGISSMVEHAVSGLLVPVGDNEALAASIVRLLRDPELRLQLGQAARKRSERNRPVQVAEITVQAYREILKEQ